MMRRRSKNNKTRKTIDLSQLIRDQLTVFNIVGDPTDLSSATPRTRKYGSKGRLYDAMELDYTIDSALASLFGAVKSFEPVIEGSDELVEFVQNKYLGHPQYWNYVDHILSAISRGLAVVQPIIEYRDGKNIIQKFVLPSIDWFRYNKDGRLLFKRKFGSYEDVTDYVYDFRFRATDEYPYGRGILQGCFVPWSLKKLMMEEWAEANLNWSSPVTVFKRPHRTFESSVESGDIAEIENIKDVGVLELYGEDDIEVLDFLKTGFHTSFKQMIQELDDGIRLIINKELLTTTEGRRVGSMALGLIHQDTKYQQVKMCTRFREMSERQVLDDLIRMNFGDVEYSYHIDITPAKNLETTLTKKKIWEGIELSDGTKPVWDVEWLADETDVKLAKDKGVVISSGRMQLSKKPSGVSLLYDRPPAGFLRREKLVEMSKNRVNKTFKDIREKLYKTKNYDDLRDDDFWSELLKPLSSEILLARMNGFIEGTKNVKPIKEMGMRDARFYDFDEMLIELKEMGYSDTEINELIDTQTKISEYFTGEQRSRIKDAFMVALSGAIVAGMSYEAFKKEKFDGLLIGLGISDWGQVIETVSRTNTSIAINGAMWLRWSKLPEIMLTYWNPCDDHSRVEHCNLRGLTMPASWEGWHKIAPPNGYNCRCWLAESTLSPTGFDEYEVPPMPEEFGLRPDRMFAGVGII